MIDLIVMIVKNNWGYVITTLGLFNCDFSIVATSKTSLFNCHFLLIVACLIVGPNACWTE